jgi:hypothetical protein
VTVHAVPEGGGVVAVRCWKYLEKVDASSKAAAAGVPATTAPVQWLGVATPADRISEIDLRVRRLPWLVPRLRPAELTGAGFRPGALTYKIIDAADTSLKPS